MPRIRLVNNPWTIIVGGTIGIAWFIIFMKSFGLFGAQGLVMDGLLFVKIAVTIFGFCIGFFSVGLCFGGWKKGLKYAAIPFSLNIINLLGWLIHSPETFPSIKFFF